MAGSPGLEPGKKASKASVIPFHHDPIQCDNYPCAIALITN